MLKSVSPWSPACILNLKIWIMKMRAPQVKIFEFLKSYISKWENGPRMNWPPPKRYTPPHMIETLSPLRVSHSVCVCGGRGRGGMGGGCPSYNFFWSDPSILEFFSNPTYQNRCPHMGHPPLPPLKNEASHLKNKPPLKHETHFHEMILRKRTINIT